MGHAPDSLAMQGMMDLFPHTMRHHGVLLPLPSLGPAAADESQGMHGLGSCLRMRVQALSESLPLGYMKPIYVHSSPS